MHWLAMVHYVFGVIDLQLRSTMLLRLWKIIVGMGHGVGGMARDGVNGYLSLRP